MITFRQVRVAWNTIRAIDGYDPQGKNAAFKDNLRARYCALRLQNALRPAVEASEESLQTLRDEFQPHMIEDPNGIRFREIKDKVEYDKREREILAQVVDGLDADAIALKMSIIGNSLKHISSDLLVDLGPFLIVDIEEPSENGKK